MFSFSVCLLRPCSRGLLAEVSYHVLPCLRKRRSFSDNHSASSPAMPAAPKSRGSSRIASGNVVAAGVNARASWVVIGAHTSTEEKPWCEFLIKVAVESEN